MSKIVLVLWMNLFGLFEELFLESLDPQKLVLVVKIILIASVPLEVKMLLYIYIEEGVLSVSQVLVSKDVLT